MNGEVKKVGPPVSLMRSRSLRGFLERYGFVLGLTIVTAAPLVDGAETTVQWGRWVKAHHGPDAVIAAIFFLSGVAMERETLFRGLLDFKAFAAALVLIFGAAPLWALGLSQWPMESGLVVGLFLVASMPTTLSSGVVMTETAGGNPATALLITIAANAAAVFATPLLLEGLTGRAAESSAVVLERVSLMGTLALLVLMPLTLGMALRRPVSKALQTAKGPKPGTINTVLVVLIVWVAVCGSRTTIVRGLGRMPGILVLGMLFHGGLLLTAFLWTRMLGLTPGRREAVILMGAQKTLPLSVLIQTAFFPQYGHALVFCVCHHILHLVMDGFVVSVLKKPRGADRRGK